MTTKFFPKGVQGEYVKPIPDEPDFVSGYSNGLAYRIVRHPSSGHLCGYVKLTKHHPLYKSATAKINKPHWRRPKAIRMLRRGYELHDIQQLDVHGGVTFFGKLSWAHGVCLPQASITPRQRHHLAHRPTGQYQRITDHPITTPPATVKRN